MAHAELQGVVALDGPSGTGKSTVARRLAATLGAAYLDTGAMYRAVTLAVLRERVDLSDVTEVARAGRGADLVVRTDPVRQSLLLNGDMVTKEIRGPEVTGAVSAVSAIAEVRESLVERQQQLIAEALAEPGGIVVEGRDIGTVVAPDAGLKVYLTASAHARAHRRNKQDVAAGREVDVQRTQQDVHRRDALDAKRDVSPLRTADDAVELDTTELTVIGVLEQLEKLIEQRGLRVGTERATR